MAAYVIYQAEVTDPEQYEHYKAAAAPAVIGGGGEYIVRGGEIDVLEGEPPSGRTVVVRFPNMVAARAWYDGDEYQAAKRLRQGAVTARAYIVDGVD